MQPQYALVAGCVLLLSLIWGGSRPAQAQVAPDEPAMTIEESEETIETPGQAEEELERQFSLQEPGISGLVIDRTVTMTGRTFYRQFSQLSLERPVLNNVVLTVHERPSARWGSQVWITRDNNRVVYQATMSPRLSDIDGYVQAAVEQVENLVIRQTLTEALADDPDLADEEL
ncbi:hypothetical protein IOC61_07615 [Halomonas sp. KAO]|uniref:CsgE family curli-type amyloid fiber assembly protein n=1 Tax=unclassified Halomonas TaxID=2609666 RepID=UPI00189CC656|nr:MULTISPECIES: CsgE family curli-type amyloid fiber assembly protein [unclassified Halomonas]MBF7053190.1 hypothetical protein [Halomonas sp. KAO]MDT0499421.1 CsgE family curli-type amyloid fiber assembly protein [Halomonas sp. PAR7]MDT0510762.1 CsgE family curli-type amyloid fiber assembly protein [Halomonas sp. LES1]MDT0591709.1 CsgE family curli-type amyloid fiber assembly protein [Halomonas sp. PAR8]